MNDRITALEARLATLERRDQRREREHTGQLRTRAEIEQQLGDAMAKDYALLAQAHDARFAELVQSVSKNAGTDEQQDAQFTIDVGVFVKGVLDCFDAITERQRRVESVFVKYIADLTVSVNAGSENERELGEAMKRTSDAVEDLHARVDGIAELFPIVKQLGRDVRGMTERVEEKLAAGRAKPPKDPRSN